MARKVILDVDTGSDDAVAIMAAVKSPDLEVIGITTTHGNLPVKFTTDNTLRVLELLGRTDIPVYAGCNEGMVKLLSFARKNDPNRTPIAAEVDGEVVAVHTEELPLPKTTAKAQSEHACSYLVRTLRETKEKITLIPVGPATNVGMALRMAPEIALNIEEIVLMGGCIDGGNKTAVAESNFYNDPEAIKIILECGAKVRIIPLNATMAAYMTDDEVAALRAINTKTSNFAAQMIEDRINAHLKLGYYDRRADHLHDALAVCAILDPSVITDFPALALDIDISGGITDGMLVADRRVRATSQKEHFVALDADRKKYYDMLAELFKD